MTAFVELALSGALLLLSVSVLTSVAYRYQEAANAIVSGVWNGAKLPWFRRRRLVFTTVLVWGGYMGSTGFTLGIGFWLMRDFASDARVGQFMILPAIASFAVSLFPCVLMPIHIRRLLRFLDTLPDAPRKAP